MMTSPKQVNILGTEIKVEFREEKNDTKLENCVGYFDSTQSLIVVKTLTPASMSLGDLARFQKEVLRHELLHAFLYESGLDGASGSVDNWATNEEMVDWFAIQSPKIFEAFRELGVL